MKTRGLVAIAAVLLLSGCATEQAAVEPSSTASASYEDQMRELDQFFGYSDEDVQSAGQSICSAMEDGTSFERAKELLGMNGMNEADASTAVRLSVSEYCPQVSG
jgi:outer membrane biogenesis lipoprotein LolB